MPLVKVISGAQTGADIAGLRAAVTCGIATGGWMPKGCVTSEGSHPDWLHDFGLSEHAGGYGSRTRENVKDSDGTIRLAFDFDSPGERCTLNAIQEFSKPYLDVDMSRPPPPEVVKAWLAANSISVLNVAGNTERSSRPIQDKVYNYLLRVFEENTPNA